jgi:hypothetical protein
LLEGRPTGGVGDQVDAALACASANGLADVLLLVVDACIRPHLERALELVVVRRSHVDAPGHGTSELEQRLSQPAADARDQDPFTRPEVRSGEQHPVGGDGSGSEGGGLTE